MDQGFGFSPPVRFHHGGGDLKTFQTPLPGILKHGKGFAHAGTHAQEDFQLAAIVFNLGLLNGREQSIGVGTRKIGHDGLF
ncbi:MAG: hypothetical protein HGA76_06870 [Candidatus Firestonebacteria bacterium]|nr:hypothetical protein [Candidatus Firestonebacteria bacterium]